MKSPHAGQYKNGMLRANLSPERNYPQPYEGGRNMKKALMLAVTILTAAALAGFSMSGVAQAKKAAAQPMMTMGEVTALKAGKSIEVKDEKGKTHKFNISKKTKIEGDVKVGAKVDVTSKGHTAEAIKVGGGAEPSAAPAAPESSAPAPSGDKY
jgi:membrane-bound ClpP family serine protease